jgi:hypothetical protein
VKRPLAVVLGVVLAGVIGACGELGPPEGAPVRELKIRSPITERVIKGYPTDSPEAALLRWWRALQQGDVGAALRLYSDRARPSWEAMGIRLKLADRYLALFNKLTIQDVDRRPGRASVLVFRENVTRAPNGRTDVTSSSRGFDLVREHGQWRLADDLFIERAVGIALAVQARALGAPQ